MCNNNTFFIAYAALWLKSLIFIVLSALDTVQDTVQYKYCIFSLLYRLLRIKLKRQKPLLSYVRERERERERESRLQIYSVVYSTFIITLMLVMSYCAYT